MKWSIILISFCKIINIKLIIVALIDVGQGNNISVAPPQATSNSTPPPKVMMNLIGLRTSPSNNTAPSSSPNSPSPLVLGIIIGVGLLVIAVAIILFRKYSNRISQDGKVTPASVLIDQNV